MTLVVDGVFFQLAQTGITRLWRTILPLLIERLEMPVVFLDRGGKTGNFSGAEVVPFPAYKSKYTADDSKLLEEVCRHYGAKVFASTYYTTPLHTPSVLLVYDMIPERLGFDLSPRDWQEKEVAISHARRHVCISNNTRRDLLEFYPEIDPALATVAHCGIDTTVFKPQDPAAVAAFRRSLELDRPYFILVGTRMQPYKNGKLLFDAVEKMSSTDFDILCVGGEKDLPSFGAGGPRVVRAELEDRELALAYAGAEALVYPSLYEGFGLPAVEAMSCQCPLISTSHGSLAEVAGDAAIHITGHSTGELIDALNRVRDSDVRKSLIERGTTQAGLFRWEPFGDHLAAAIRQTASDAASGAFHEFYERWGLIRSFQAEVDALM
ncbi:glycosyltransferase family 4 protein [Xenophilus aerolatus]|nr:glycosyltransferase family 1 protein [Xenophilus aerolatus]